MDHRKSGTICHRIIRYNDVLTLATFFEKMVNEYGGIAFFWIYFRDHSSVSSSQIDIFSSDVLRRKDIRSISFSYKDESHRKTLDVRFSEEYVLSDITNTYEISSSDEIWYNATLAQLNELLGTITKHMWVRRIFDFPLIIVSYFLYWVILFGILLGPLGFEFGKRPENATVFIPTSLLFVLGTFLFAVITLCIYLLFPDMEFDFDTPRGIACKRIRKAIVWILGTIAIPIILSMIMG